MKKLFLVLAAFPAILFSQSSSDTVSLCVRDTVCFTNWQYDNCQPTECGHIITVVDSNSTRYETIPANYVFDPAYQAPYTEEKYCLNLTTAGVVKLKFTDYDFYTGRVNVSYKYLKVRSCRDTIVSGTNDTIIVVWPVKNSERRFRSIYMPSVFTADQPLYPFTESHYEVIIKQMIVYDVSGNVVFRKENFWTNDPSSGWEGKHFPAGMYVWEVKTMTYTKVGSSILVK